MTTPSEALPFSPSACPPSAAEAGRSPACCPHQFRIVEAMQTPRLSENSSVGLLLIARLRD